MTAMDCEDRADMYDDAKVSGGSNSNVAQSESCVGSYPTSDSGDDVITELASVPETIGLTCVSPLERRCERLVRTVTVFPLRQCARTSHAVVLLKQLTC